METVGQIYKVKENQAIIIAPVNPYLIERQNIQKCVIRYDDGRYISADQRKKVYSIIGDIAEYTGNVPEFEKELLKCFYMARYGVPHFSLSDCSMTTATDFISFLIDFCFENNIGTRDILLNNCDDISRYLYSCIANRKCVICNEKAEIHHCHGSRVGMGFDRKKIHNVGRYAIAICRKHHNTAHNDEEDLLDKHHVYGIKLDEYLCKKVGLKP